MVRDHEWENLPDRDLVDRARSDPSPADRSAAFSGIFKKHHNVVLALCAGRLRDPHLAADAVAETFTTAFEDLSRLEDPSKLRGWLIRIAKNRCLALFWGRFFLEPYAS